MLAVPKNLVYVFAIVIFFAFGCMVYITYTEKDMKAFMNTERTQIL